MNRPLMLAASLGSLGGFAGGALVTGNALAAVGAVLVAVWSLLVGVFLVAPIAGNKGKERLMDMLAHPTERDADLLEAVVLNLADRTTKRFDQELSLPSDAPKPVLALTNRLAKAFAMSIRGEAAALTRDIGRNLGDTESLADKWDVVKSAAKKAGREIPPQYEKLGDTLSMLSELMGGEGGKKRPGRLTGGDTYGR